MSALIIFKVFKYKHATVSRAASNNVTQKPVGRGRGMVQREKSLCLANNRPDCQL